ALEDRLRHEEVQVRARPVLEGASSTLALRALAALHAGPDAPVPDAAHLGGGDVPAWLRIRTAAASLADSVERVEPDRDDLLAPAASEAAALVGRARAEVAARPADRLARGALRAAHRAHVAVLLRGADRSAALGGLLDFWHEVELDDPVLDLMRWVQVADGFFTLLNAGPAGAGGGDAAVAGDAAVGGDAAAAVALEGLEASRRHHRAHPGFAVGALTQVARLALRTSQVELAEESSSAAVALLAEAPESQSVLGLRLANNLTMSDARSARGELAGALAAQRAAIEAGRAIGPGAHAWTTRGQGLLLRAAGRLDESVVAFAEAAELFHHAGDHLERARLLLERARAEQALGDWRSAGRSAEAARASLTEGPTEPRLLVDVIECSAQVAEHTGDDAVARWEEAADLEHQLSGCGASYRSSGALAASAAGEAARAAAMFERSLAEADAVDGERERTWYCSMVLHRRAQSSVRGEPLAGLVDATAAAAGFEQLGFPDRAARSLWLAADAYLALGDNESSLEALRRALGFARQAGDAALIGRLSQDVELAAGSAGSSEPRAGGSEPRAGGSEPRTGGTGD
ncbi:MAG TPA: hypothetical protein VMD59_12610, partial [Acidimicrobiales bacterium]|nr:hypothetical protein [Acidimicrobiales bacterium]